MRNHYSKKSMLALAAMMLAPAFSMQAGWGSAETPDIVFRSDDISSLHTARTADGKTYLVWAAWSGIVGDGYNLHMQLLDADGNSMWGDEGIVLETKPNASWFADYSIVTTENGDAIVSWADAREDPEGDYQSLTPVLYKISQQKEMLWGEDGVFLGADYRFPPKLYNVEGDIYAKIYVAGEEEAAVLTRLDADGGFAVEPVSFSGSIIPSVGGDFIAVYTGAQGTEAMRYNRDIQPVWSAPALVSSYLYEGYDTDPFILESDGMGGVVISYIRPMGMFGHMPIVQYVSADGEPVFGEAVDVYGTEMYDHLYPVLAVDQADQSIFCAWQMSGGVAILAGQQFDFFGERTWGDEGRILASKDDPSGYTYGAMDAACLVNGNWLVCFANELGWAQNQMNVGVYDHAGNEIWCRHVSTPGAIYNYSCYLEGDDYYIFWVNEVTDDDWNTERMIQTVKISDVTTGVETITSDSARKDIEAYYSLDGARHSSPVKGVNIVRYSDGSSRKIMVK